MSTTMEMIISTCLGSIAVSSLASAIYLQNILAELRKGNKNVR